MPIKYFVPFTGIFTYPMFALLFWFIIESFQNLFVIPNVVRILIIYVLPIIFPVIITVTNFERKARGQVDFSFSEVYGLGNKDPKHSKEYLEAAYPDVPAKYTSKIPKGLVLGKHKGKYVMCPIGKDGCNIFVVGTPGSGKSVELLGWLYSMIYREEIAKKAKEKPSDPFSFFLVDIKGELYMKLLQIGEKEYSANDYSDFHVVQPSNRSSYGYDVFYRLRKNNLTQTERIKAITDITESLIMEAGNNDSPYFSENAKKLMAGFLYFFSLKNYEFVDIIKIIMRTNLEELLHEVLKEAKEKRIGFVLDKLALFEGKSGNESIQDVEATLQVYLSVFSYPDIEYCLKNNPLKTSPAKLREGINIDLAIEESMLTTYQPIFRLICMQMLKECEEFKESDERKTMLIFDEAARIGKVDSLDAAMSTLRSKHVSLICLFQSISQFKHLYPSEMAKTLLNLCEIKLFLSGGDKETADYVAALAGDYEATKMSYKRKGAFGGKSDGNYSTERRPIIDAKEMAMLREKGECISFLYGHYIRCKKLRYFEDPILAPLLKRKKEEKTKAK